MAITKIRGETQIMAGSIKNAQIAADAAIALSKLADGTKLMKDDSATLQANMDANSHKITGLADGASDNDAVNYGQLQQVATQGKSWKEVIFHQSQLKDGASGGIYAAQVLQLSANLQSDDTITLNDGSSAENYVAGTDFTIGADINETLSNLSTAINAGAIAVTATTGALDSMDDTNNVLVMWQDTIGEATRIYGNAAAAARCNMASTSLDNLYEADSGDLTAIPTADPSATNFGFSRAKASLVVNETHYARENDASYSWDSDAEVWNMTGQVSIPYASTTVYGKVKISNGIAVSSGVISVDPEANKGIAVGASGVSVDYDDSTVGIVGNKLAIKTDGVTKTEINADVAGDGLGQDGEGALKVNVDDSSIEINADTLRIKADGVAASHINPDVAGDGLGQDGGGALKVNVDDSTIEINTDALRVKADGITKSHIAADVAGDGLVQAAGGELDVNVDGSTIEISGDAIQVKADGINETHVNWGSGANQVDATSLPLDSGGTYGGAAANAQDALEELEANKTSEAFKTIAVSGQDNVVADDKDDLLTFVAGTDITITTNATTDTITIACSGASSITASLGCQRVGNDIRSDLKASGGLKLDGNDLMVEPNDFAGSGLEDDGSDNLRIASSAAGNGLTGGSGSALAVQAVANKGLSVGAGGVECTVNGNAAMGVDASGLKVIVESDGGIQFDGVNGGLEVKLDGSTLTAGASGLKLSNLNEGWILRGNASSIPTGVRRVVRETPNESPNGAITEFTVDYTPIAGQEMVFLNGILQQDGGNDYTLDAGNKKVTFGVAPETGDVILVSYLASN